MNIFDDPLQAVQAITSPDGKYSTENRGYQGIPGIEITPEGRLWACWYSGGETEGPENYTLLVTSADGGRSWTEPVLVLDSPGNVRTFDSALWLDPVGRLWIFWAQTYSEKDGNIFDGRAGCWAMFTENPENASPAWSSPVRIADGIMLNKPTVLTDGSWIFPVALWRDNLGGGKLVQELKPFSGANLFVSRDQGKTFEYRGGTNIPERWFDEHMFVEKRDGRIWNLVRTSYGIGQSFSSDGGRSWTPGENTGWGGPNSRFFIRRLKSGRLLLVNHAADPETGKFTRNRLSAYLSDDDGESWYGGLMLDERLGVSYPDGAQDADGRIWIIYDHERYKKGDILFAVFREEDIAAGKCVSSEASLRNLINSTGGNKDMEKRNQTNVM